MTVPSLNSLPGLVLFPSQHKIILSSAASSNPLFMRVLLKALHWSAAQNMDLWRIMGDWMQADSVTDLYERILNTWEMGLATSPTTTAEAEKAAAREGGRADLRGSPDGTDHEEVPFGCDNACRWLWCAAA